MRAKRTELPQKQFGFWEGVERTVRDPATGRISNRSETYGYPHQPVGGDLDQESG